uniref:Bm1434 n=1 Tax=Brugia malayi TaxID=6279 RepID=A0A1I9G3L1_BRUMA|nr:Bm1434 [Brugia malayi]
MKAISSKYIGGDNSCKKKYDIKPNKSKIFNANWCLIIKHPSVQLLTSSKKKFKEANVET